MSELDDVLQNFDFSNIKKPDEILLKKISKEAKKTYDRYNKNIDSYLKDSSIEDICQSYTSEIDSYSKVIMEDQNYIWNREIQQNIDFITSHFSNKLKNND